MNTEDFIQTVRCTLNLSKNSNEILEILPYIDEVRKLHKRFQNELEYLLLDPTTYESINQKEKINKYTREIKENCNIVSINCIFFKLPVDHMSFSKTFRSKKCFSKYYYQNIDITGLISYPKNKKEFIIKENNKKTNVIKEYNLDYDEFMNSEINKLPGE